MKSNKRKGSLTTARNKSTLPRQQGIINSPTSTGNKSLKRFDKNVFNIRNRHTGDFRDKVYKHRSVTGLSLKELTDLSYSFLSFFFYKTEECKGDVYDGSFRRVWFLRLCHRSGTSLGSHLSVRLVCWS